MIVLGIDSASGACSAAAVNRDGVLAHRFEAMQRGQAEALAPMMEAVLGEARLTPGDISTVAVTIGPGAFTGVRIGLSAARAFALAVSVPVIGVTTFAVIAEPLQAHVETDILAVVESRRSDFFVQLIAADGHESGPPAALTGAEVGAYVRTHGSGAELTLAGDGADRLAASGALAGLTTHRAPGAGWPDAAAAGRLALRRIADTGLPDRRERPSPLYLRPPDVKLPGSA